MQPHVNLGIRFRTHFEHCYSKKRHKARLFHAERVVQVDYLKKKVSREGAVAKLTALALELMGLKARKKRGRG